MILKAFQLQPLDFWVYEYQNILAYLFAESFHFFVYQFPSEGRIRRCPLIKHLHKARTDCQVFWKTSMLPALSAVSGKFFVNVTRGLYKGGKLIAHNHHLRVADYLP
jgi:hypothetical protein